MKSTAKANNKNFVKRNKNGELFIKTAIIGFNSTAPRETAKRVKHASVKFPKCANRNQPRYLSFSSIIYNYMKKIFYFATFNTVCNGLTNFLSK